jgi:hypothetical protein
VTDNRESVEGPDRWQFVEKREWNHRAAEAERRAKLAIQCVEPLGSSTSIACYYDRLDSPSAAWPPDRREVSEDSLDWHRCSVGSLTQVRRGDVEAPNEDRSIGFEQVRSTVGLLQLDTWPANNPSQKWQQ